MPEQKMKRYLVLSFLLLTAGFMTSLNAQIPRGHAQLPEQRPQARLNMDEILNAVDRFTLAYIEGVTEKQRNGFFPLSQADAKRIREILDQIVRALSAIDDRGSIAAHGLNADSQETLRLALECARCGRDADVIKVRTLPETVKDLRQLLISRCKAISSIISAAKPPLSKDLVLLLEVHVSYLRQITIAYTTPRV